jgi:hypothetical protein
MQYGEKIEQKSNFKILTCAICIYYRQKIIDLFKEGNCTPQISVIAKTLKEPATTIHYNIKRLETLLLLNLVKYIFFC